MILEPGEKYMIHLQISNLADLVWYFVDGNPYTNGDSSIGECCDFAFKTYAWVNNYPTSMTIDGPKKGKPGAELCWTFHSEDPNDNDVKYIIDWGDGNSEETGFNEPCTPVEVCHTYEEQGTYTIKVKAKDTNDAESNWAELVVTMPRNRATQRPFLQFLEQYPILYQILQRFLRL